MEDLEKFLSSIPAINPRAEHEIDLLRLILQGKAGTMVQRAMLIRIIKQNRQKSKNFPLRLAQKLGDTDLTAHHQNRVSYMIPAPRTRVQAKKQKQVQWQANVQRARVENERTRNDLHIPEAEYRSFMRLHPRHVILTRNQMNNMWNRWRAANSTRMDIAAAHTPRPPGLRSRDRRRQRRQMQREGVATTPLHTFRHFRLPTVAQAFRAADQDRILIDAMMTPAQVRQTGTGNAGIFTTDDAAANGPARNF